MANISKSSIALLLIMALLTPAKLLAHSPAVVEQPASPSGSASSSLPMLVVVSPDPVSALALSSGTSCDTSINTSANLVQDTGLINFNQPATCFAIHHKQLVLQPHLSVHMADTEASIGLAKRPAFSWNNFKVPEPLTPMVPILPASTVALLLTLSLSSFDPLKRKLRRITLSFISVLTLSQLQMRRC